jgi:hypothetical protein
VASHTITVSEVLDIGKLCVLSQKHDLHDLRIYLDGLGKHTLRNHWIQWGGMGGGNFNYLTYSDCVGAHSGKQQRIIVPLYLLYSLTVALLSIMFETL